MGRATEARIKEEERMEEEEEYERERLENMK
jgi:hypothetical protein